MSIDSVFNCSGILEYVLSYCSTKDLTMATEVNVLWKQAGRSDFLWKDACRRFWKDRVGMRELSGEDFPLFWRSCLSDKVIQNLTIRQMKAFFDHLLLSDIRKQIENCSEKSEVIRIFRKYRNDQIAIYQFNDIWFGSFASSAMDAKRERILMEELCNPYGFDMYFKIPTDEIPLGFINLEPYEGHPDVMLYRHCVCYFKEQKLLVCETYSTSEGKEEHHALQWVLDGCCAVKVRQFPPLDITRLPDSWGWKLENDDVVMIFRDSKRTYDT